MYAQATSRFLEIFDWQAWAAWFGSLDRDFLFLLLLPFVIAVMGVWASLQDEDDPWKPDK